MSGLVDNQSLEADIADCCRAILSATEPEAAMLSWTRLRELKRQWADLEFSQFVRETRGVAPPARDDAEANALICLCD